MYRKDLVPVKYLETKSNKIRLGYVNKETAKVWLNQPMTKPVEMIIYLDCQFNGLEIVPEVSWISRVEPSQAKLSDKIFIRQADTIAINLATWFIEMVLDDYATDFGDKFGGSTDFNVEELLSSAVSIADNSIDTDLTVNDNGNMMDVYLNNYYVASIYEGDIPSQTSLYNPLSE